jgi:ribosomal protein S18 acetylase RimI-like enzyme
VPNEPARDPEITIRRAEAADAEAVSDVYLESFHATYEFPLAHSDDEVRAWIRGVVAPAHGTWVATVADRIVGMLVVREGELDQLYVLPACHGRKVGRRLVEVAKRESPSGLGLYTFQVNARARRFYERNGFMADAFGDGTGNEEGQPDVHFTWRPSRPTGTRRPHPGVDESRR